MTNNRRAALRVAAYIEQVLEDTPLDVENIAVGRNENGFVVNLHLGLSTQDFGVVDSTLKQIEQQTGVPLLLDGKKFHTEEAVTVVASDEPLDIEDQLNLDLVGFEQAAQESVPVKVTNPATEAVVTRRKQRPDGELEVVQQAHKKAKEVKAERVVTPGPTFMDKNELARIAKMFIAEGNEE